MEKLEDARSESDVNAVRQLFESLKGIKDVTECLQKCDEKIAQLKKEEEEENARNRKIAIFLCIFAAAIVAVFLLLS